MQWQVGSRAYGGGLQGLPMQGTPAGFRSLDAQYSVEGFFPLPFFTFSLLIILKFS